MNKVILYIATSQDGFIADQNGNIDWLPQPKDDTELEIFGYNSLMNRIDTILMGSRSYKQILTFGDWGWPEKQTYVFTSQPLTSEKSYITITHDSPHEFMAKIKQRNAPKDIWLLGGAQLTDSFTQEHLIDEIILTIIPQTLKAGIFLTLKEGDFILKSEQQLMNGIIQKHYLKKN
jgi:dihydrofolate reductase